MQKFSYWSCVTACVLLSPLACATSVSKFHANGLAGGNAVDAHGFFTLMPGSRPLQLTDLLPKPASASEFRCGPTNGETRVASGGIERTCIDDDGPRAPATVVPEPLSMALVGMGLVSIYWVGRQKKENKSATGGFRRI